MSLEIHSSRLSAPQIIGIIVLAIIAACLIKVFIWEQIYYSEKEGSMRSPAIQVSSSDDEEFEVDETPISETEIREYIVAADKPRYLSIPKINVTNARILEVGLVNDSNKLDSPTSIYDVGWYNKSAKPGTGGTLLMDGHNGGPTTAGVFKKLDTLTAGDEIIIERGDGQIFTYQVVESQVMDLDDAADYMATMETSPIAGKESLSLITCAGEWTNVEHTYLSRAMIRAVLISTQNT